MAYQPYYIAYAKAHGRTPGEQEAHDEATWRGGRMTGFMLWISEQQQKFKAAHPECFLYGNIADQDAWSKWLVAAAKGGE